MTDLDAHAAEIRRQFGAAAGDYVLSPAHATGDDLDILRSWAEGGRDKRLLDVATGGGHTALALSELFAQVVASDLTQDMLRAAEEFIRSKGVTNVEFLEADAEQLPFDNASFDAVSCRIAAHHFSHSAWFVRECHRVLKSGGILLLEDSIAPPDRELDRVVNRMEQLRDPTHVQSLTQATWLKLLQACGFIVEDFRVDRKSHGFREWMDRSRTPEAQRTAIFALLREAGQPAIDRFSLELDSDGNYVSFTDEKLLVKARKPS